MIEKQGNDSENENRQLKDDRQEMWQLNDIRRFSNLRYHHQMMGLFIYVAMFLGVLAFIISGSILILQQFSEAEKERENKENRCS